MSRLSPAPVKNAPTIPANARYSPAHRPTWIDFFLLLIGFSLSLILADWSGFHAHETSATPPPVKDFLLPHLPALLLLSVGVLLFWPVFFFTQWVRGRREPMSSGEWLWGVAWLAVLPWVALVSWQPWDALPDVVDPATFKYWVFLGYAVGVLALGSLATLITLVGWLGRWRQPWTHNLCLVLLIWPALWLGCCLAWGITLQ
jgi:hypothetical protein